jgi:hypothetical protein
MSVKNPGLYNRLSQSFINNLKKTEYPDKTWIEFVEGLKIMNDLWVIISEAMQFDIIKKIITLVRESSDKELIKKVDEVFKQGGFYL